MNVAVGRPAAAAGRFINGTSWRPCAVAQHLAIGAGEEVPTTSDAVLRRWAADTAADTSYLLAAAGAVLAPLCSPQAAPDTPAGALHTQGACHRLGVVERRSLAAGRRRLGVVGRRSLAAVGHHRLPAEALP